MIYQQVTGQVTGQVSGLLAPQVAVRLESRLKSRLELDSTTPPVAPPVTPPVALEELVRLIGAAKPSKSTVQVRGMGIAVIRRDEEDFISLTDIAQSRTSDHTNNLIRNRLRNCNTLEPLGTWDQLHNARFNPVEIDGIEMQDELNSFTLMPKHKHIKSRRNPAGSPCGYLGFSLHNEPPANHNPAGSLCGSLGFSLHNRAPHPFRLGLDLPEATSIPNRPSRIQADWLSNHLKNNEIIQFAQFCWASGNTQHGKLRKGPWNCNEMRVQYPKSGFLTN